MATQDKKSTEPVADHAAAELDKRNRLVVPRNVRSHTALVNESLPRDLLVVLDEPGLIRLLPLERWTEKIEAHRKRLAEASDHDALLVFADRYTSVQIGDQHRVQFSTEMLLHLNLMPDDRWVYVETDGTEIRILSREYRNARLLRVSQRFPELP